MNNKFGSVMDPKPKRICVVGAGISGLCAIKNCLEENLDVQCYEKSDDIGGLWNYKKNFGKNHATVMESTVINTSKEMLAFSDFPPPGDWPNWMHHSLVCQYLKMYAEKYDLTKHVQLNTSAQKIEKAADYDATGRWIVHLENGKQETFDGVMICSGQFTDPQSPKFEGMESFSGPIIHSHMYRNWEPYENKRVLIVGLGNSSMDIAIELGKMAKMVYVSTVRGGWVWSRLGIRGWPTDVRYQTRLADHIFTVLPKSFTNSYFEHLLNMRIDHTDFGLKPKHRVLEQYPIFSDQLPTCISNGSVMLKEGVKRFHGNTIIFEDDSEHAVDAVILCTGYSISFPFLDQSLSPIKDDGSLQLYKSIFPPKLAHPTLAFIGMVQSLGGIGPVSELQGRWTAKIFNGKLQLPSGNQMQQDITKMLKRNEKNFYKSAKHLLHVSYVEYMNELSGYIGSRPNMTKLLITDPKLFYHCYIGPCTSYTYRLQGPGSWPGARQTIMTTVERIDQPMTTRKGEPAVWKLLNDQLKKIHILDWSLLFLVVWAWVTFASDNDLFFYISATLLFSYLAILSYLADACLDFSTSF